MGDKIIMDTCIDAIVILSSLYKDNKIDEETYIEHIKLKIKVLNDFLK